jgi:hypothetical protein
MLALPLFACGLNVGSPPRRVFPNPTSTSSLERTPERTPAVPLLPACRIAGAGQASIDYAAPAPWGVRMRGNTVLGVFAESPVARTALRDQIARTLGTCPAGANHHHRVVVDLVEVDRYEGGNAYDAARVVLRMERFDDAYAGVDSWRAVGIVRVPHGRGDTALLVKMAGADALDALLGSEAPR